MAVSAEIMAGAVARYTSAPQEGSIAAGLHPYQLSVVRDIGTSWEDGHLSGYVKAPTGTGKTRMALAVIEATHAADSNARTLMVVPRINLIQQATDEFGRSSAVLDGGITAYYGGDKNLEGRVNITTYTSFLLGLSRGDITPADYTLLILDEAHHVMPGNRAAAVRSFGGLQLGLTATPDWGANRRLRTVLAEEISNMSIRQAVEGNMLSAFSVYLVKTGINLTDVKVRGKGANKDFDEHALARAVNITARNQAAVDLYEQSLVGRQAVAYCSGIEHARALAEQFNNRGIKAAAIWGDEPEKWKDLLLEQYRKGNIQVICNADLLIEGFDDVKTSVALNLRPTLSPLLAEQRGGRALRLDWDDRTKQAIIIDFIDEVDGANNPISFAQVAEAAQITNTWYQSSSEGEVEHFGLTIPKLRGMKVLTGKAEVMWAVNELSGMDFEIEEGWKTLRRISAESGIPLDVLKIWEGDFLEDPARRDEVKDFVSPHGQSVRHYDLGVALHFINSALFLKGYSPNKRLEGEDLYLRHSVDEAAGFEITDIGVKILRRLRKIDPESLMKYAGELYDQLVERGDEEFARYFGLYSKEEAHAEALLEANDPKEEISLKQVADSQREDKFVYDGYAFKPETVEQFKAVAELGSGALIALKLRTPDGKRLFMQLRYVDVPESGSSTNVIGFGNEDRRPKHLLLVDVYTNEEMGMLKPIAHLDWNDEIFDDPKYTRIAIATMPAARADSNVHRYVVPQSVYEGDAQARWKDNRRNDITDFSSYVEDKYAGLGIGSLMLAASINCLKAKGFNSFFTGILTTREDRVYKGMGITNKELSGRNAIDIDRIANNPLADAAIERYLKEGKAHI